MAFLEFHPGAVVDIAHLASAVEVIHQHQRAVQHHVSAVFDGIAVDCQIVVCRGTVVGLLSQHVACVAAAVYGAYTALCQGDVGHLFH